MKRIMTFSTVFPVSHPRKGEPTYFVEKIWKCLNDTGLPLPIGISGFSTEIFPKYHTIRSGNRWSVGDMIDPRIWSGKPYQSKQVQFSLPIQIKKIWNFEMDLNGVYSINGKYWMEDHEVETLALNDGLSVEDMMYWLMPDFNKPKEFKGQILCWGESVEY